MSADTDYDFKFGLAIAKTLNQNSEWKNWFVVGGQYPTPPFNLLFAKPGSGEPVPQRGTYQLEIKSILFEENSDIQSKLILLGQVYGAAGTEHPAPRPDRAIILGNALHLDRRFYGNPHDHTDRHVIASKWAYGLGAGWTH